MKSSNKGASVKSLLKYLGKYKKETILAPLLKMLEASFELIVPLIVSNIVDVGISSKDTKYIMQRCALLIAMALAGFCVTFVAQYFATKASTGFAATLRKVVFDHVQGLSFTELDSLGNDTIITRITSDVNQIETGVNLTLRLLLRAPFVVFGAMIMSMTINVRIGLIFLAVIIILFIIVGSIMKKTMPLYRKVQNELDNITLSTRENLNGVRVIRAFNMQDSEKRKFFKINKKLEKFQNVAGNISGLMNPATYFVINAGIICIIYFGAVRVNAGIITTGGVVALLNYMSQILVELIKLTNLIITVSKSYTCGDRIEEVIELKKENREGIDADVCKNGDTVVEFDDVSLVYRNSKKEALKNISFKAQKGQTIGIIGGTGSGKSSLVGMIPAFYTASSGRVSVNGIDVEKMNKNSLRDKVGIVFQGAELFTGSIKDNLKWGNQCIGDDELLCALNEAQASDIIEKKGGLDSFVEQSGKNFSGGQKQRLTIARALVKKPEILILDDSASALDFATDAKLRDSIRSMHSEMTIFIVSQRAASVRFADLILVLDDGHIAGSGKHEDLLKSNEIYQEIYFSQFPEEAKHFGK